MTIDEKLDLILHLLGCPPELMEKAPEPPPDVPSVAMLRWRDVGGKDSGPQRECSRCVYNAINRAVRTMRRERV